MCLGQIVELADRIQRYASSLHPYTRALLSAVPALNPAVGACRQRIILRGELPSPVSAPSGCRFHLCRPTAQEICERVEPERQGVRPGRWAACHLAE
jgi:oligopeptide/dipeptide ABC transporter ATP-binding protein